MSQNKYVMLAANSSLKGKSDFNKFHKAMQLKGCIDKVRRDYQRHLDSSDRQLKQQATTMWLIDVLALRVGGEKNEDEADTVRSRRPVVWRRLHAIDATRYVSHAGTSGTSSRTSTATLE